MGDSTGQSSGDGKCDERVLVVDDDEQIRHLLTAVLNRVGVCVEVASDGEEALRKLNEKDYDLVLLDLMMPRIDGFEVIQCLETLPSRRPAIVVVSASPVSANVNSDCVKEIVDKPFDINRLVDVVCRLLKCDHHRNWMTA